MKNQAQSVTSLPMNPDADRKARMIKYTVAMTIRVVCIVLMLVVQGWWLVVFAAGAIFLPYFAVLIANVQGAPRTNAVRRPGGLLRFRATQQDRDAK